MNIQKQLKKSAQSINFLLAKKNPPAKEKFQLLNQAINYVVLNENSNRIRSFLFQIVTQLLLNELNELSLSKMKIKYVIREIGLSLEMIHDYSLIHDDLPCMDNSDFRRNKESCHKKYGEGISLLAGNALFSYAIHNIASIKVIDPEFQQKLLKIIQVISETFGPFYGVIYGQSLDIIEQYKIQKLPDNIKDQINMKTDSFFEMIAQISIILTNISKVKQKAILNYMKVFGKLYQIIDDIKDSEIHSNIFIKDFKDENEVKSYVFELISLMESDLKVFKFCKEKDILYKIPIFLFSNI